MLALVVAEGVAIALLGALVVGLLRSHALILRALHELGAGLDLEDEAGADHLLPVQLGKGASAPTRPHGSVASDVLGVALDGDERSIPVGGDGQRTLLAFLSSGCAVCQTFWDQMSRRDLDVPGDARLVVVAKSREEESSSVLGRLAGSHLDVVQSSGAWSDYGVPGSPYFVYVEAGSITGEGSATSWAQVRDLMAQAVDDVAVARAARAVPDGGSRADGDARDLARADRELFGAGIHPGHVSLYQSPDAGSLDETAHAHGAHP